MNTTPEHITKLLLYDQHALIHEKAFSSGAVSEQFLLPAAITKSAAKNSNFF